jgi:hypothetical protein
MTIGIGFFVLGVIGAFVLGSLEGGRLVTWIKGLHASHAASKAVSNAKAVLAAEEARVAALETAKKVVASAPVPTGTSGPAGA